MLPQQATLVPVVPKYNLEIYEREAFPVIAPIMCDNLRENIRITESVFTLKEKLIQIDLLLVN